jgi:hypothetical protein
MAENVLHDYVNWTYNLSLYSLSKAGLNSMQTSPTMYPPGTRCLIASADRDDGDRSPHFDTVFFFEKMSLEGTNSQNTNNFSISFSVIEPMGCTLYNRLIAEAKDTSYDNVTEMNFIMKIDFFGYTMGGAPTKIPGTTKVLCIKVQTITMKITHRGSEYAFTATPSGHADTLGSAVGSTPLRIETTGSTVAEIFGKGKDSPIKSFADSINKYYQTLVKDKKMESADEIEFDIHPDILNAKLTSSDEIASLKRHMEAAGKEQQQGTKTRMEPVKYSIQNMSFEAGTAITEVLGMVIRHSEFITEQIKDDENKEGTPSNGTVNWFKIIPGVIYNDYIKSSNRFAKKYIYHVIPYVIYNTRNRSFPIQVGGGEAIKEYNYIFTGKNKDVINIDLMFDMTYFTSLTTNQVNVGVASGTKAPARTEDPATPGASAAQMAYDAASKAAAGEDLGFAGPTMPLVDAAGLIASVGSNSKSDKARQLQSSLPTAGNGADLLNLKLKIVGDPDLIKQDDVTFWNIQPGQTETETGSKVFDNEQRFVAVNFKSASDYNSVGMAIPGTDPYSVGVFSGKYTINLIRSEFSGGKFTQELELIRYPLQQGPNTFSGGNIGGASSYAGIDRSAMDARASSSGNSGGGENGVMGQFDVRSAPTAINNAANLLDSASLAINASGNFNVAAMPLAAQASKFTALGPVVAQLGVDVGLARNTTNAVSSTTAPYSEVTQTRIDRNT